MSLATLEKSELLKDFVDQILSNYRLRVDKVAQLMNEVLSLLVEYHSEQERMMEELKSFMCHIKSLRKTDFDVIVGELRLKQQNKEKELHELIVTFIRREHEMIDVIKTSISDRKLTVEAFQKLKSELLISQGEREKEIGRVLRGFHLEVQEVSQYLRKLLKRGERLQVRDLRDFVSTVYLQIEERDMLWGSVWDEFWVLREKINQEWEVVTERGGSEIVNVP